jgi:hypothetical protein
MGANVPAESAVSVFRIEDGEDHRIVENFMNTVEA